MRVTFRQDLNISDLLIIRKGESFEAKRDGYDMLVKLPLGNTLRIPESEIEEVMQIEE